MDCKAVKNDIIKTILANEQKLEDILCSMRNFDLTEVLPGMRKLHEYDNSNICYHGRECELNIQQLYEYKNFYVVYQADGEGNDMEVANYKHNYGSLRDFLEACIMVVKRDGWKYQPYLSAVDSIISLTKFFKSMFGETGEEIFLTHCKVRYRKE